MKSITVRGIDPSVADMLKNEAAREGKSVNQFIKDIIDAKFWTRKQEKALSYLP